MTPEPPHQGGRGSEETRAPFWFLMDVRIHKDPHETGGGSAHESSHSSHMTTRLRSVTDAGAITGAITASAETQESLPPPPSGTFISAHSSVIDLFTALGHSQQPQPISRMRDSSPSSPHGEGQQRLVM